MEPEPTNHDRAIDAALRCFGRFGLAKTTLDDIATEAGMSRATLYRVFPGGRENLYVAVVEREVGSFLAKLEAELHGLVHAEDLITVGVGSALRFIRTHVILGTVLQQEPPVATMGPAFSDDDPAYALIRSFVDDHLHAFFSDPSHLDAFVEVLVRLILSFASQPSPLIDPDDESTVRTFVRRHLTPALDVPI